MFKLLRDVYGITPRWRPKFSPAAPVGPLILWHASIVASAPGFRRESCVGPLSLDSGTVPSVEVIQHKHQSALHTLSIALHHVEVIVHVKDARGSAGVFLMNLDQRGDTATFTFLR